MDDSTSISAANVSSVLGAQTFAHSRLFYPLGFPVCIETTSPSLLEAAEESWGGQTLIATEGTKAEPLMLRLGVTSDAAPGSPTAPHFRANHHLLSIIADAENFIVCDLERGFAFGSISASTAGDRAYLRYHFLEAAVLCLLTGSRVTPIHAACVSLHGCGLLLCGGFGAGKSTLAYACARAGFTYTTDDASYVVWQNGQARVRGNSDQLRLRPSGLSLFPEFAGYDHTPGTEGKPSIEVRLPDLTGNAGAREADVHALVLLSRQPGGTPELRPLAAARMELYLTSMLYPAGAIRERQQAALHPLRSIAGYELCFDDLPRTVAYLEQMTLRLTNR